MDVPQVETFGSWGVLGLLAWLLFRTFTRTLPEFRQSMTEAHEQFDATLTNQRNDFAQMLRGERKEMHACLTTIKDAISDLAQRCPGGKGE